MISLHFCHRRSWIHLVLIMLGLRSIKCWSEQLLDPTSPERPFPGTRGKCFLFCPQPRVPVSAHTLSWVHLSAGTELDYDGSSLFINATITLLNLQRNTLIGNLKLRSNISHAPAKLMLLMNLTNKLSNIGWKKDNRIYSKYSVLHKSFYISVFQAVQDV